MDVSAGWGRSRTLKRTDVLLLRWAGLTACLMLLGSGSTLGEVTQNSSWAQHRPCAEGTPDTKTTVGQRPVNAQKCCLSSCVAPVTCLCEDVWVWAQKLFLVRAQPCHSTDTKLIRIIEREVFPLISCFSFSMVVLTADKLDTSLTKLCKITDLFTF